MVLGLATVSTSAAYSDANDIDYSEAVDVMTAVGVFQGKGDAFAPKDGLNRAEAAKLIAYLMLGNKTAEAMKGTGAKFADVPASHWASGYIEYLATAGVVSGVGNNQFNPNGQVTAVQFAKMLLVALGYDAQIEGFSGNSSWAINIQKLANDNDLYDLLDLTSDAALNREQAAQMCLNDLKADMVEYESKGTTVKVGEAEVTTDAKKADKKTTTNNKGKAINDDDASGSANNPYTLQLGEELYGTDLKLESVIDALGRPADKWTYKNVEVGTYDNTSDVIYTATKAVSKKALYDVVGKDAYDSIVKTLAGTANNDEFEVYVDGAQVTTPVLSNYIDKDNTGDSGASGRAVLTQLFKTDDINSNNNDRYTLTFTRTHLVQATADYSTSNKSVKISYVEDNGASKPTNFPSEIKEEDFAVSNVKEDDYLLVTWSDDTDEIQSVKPATIITGKVTSYVFESSVTVDGTKYEYGKLVGANDDMGKSIQFDVDSTVVLVTDGSYILAVDDKDASASYVYIQKAGTTGTGKYAEAIGYFTDGSSKTFNVKKADWYTGGWAAGNLAGESTNATAVAGGIKNQWFTYSVDDDGLYTLKPVGKVTEYTEGQVDTTTSNSYVLRSDYVTFLYTANQTTKDTGLSAIKGDSSTVILVLDDDDDVSIYTGIDNVPDMKIGTVAGGDHVYVTYAQKSGYAKYVFVDASAVKSVIDDSTTSDDYTFLLKQGDKYTDDSKNTYYEWDAIVDGAETKVKVDEGATLYAGVLYNKIHTNSKGFITSASIVEFANGSKQYAEYTLPEDTKAHVGGTATAVPSSTGTISYKNGTLTIGDDSFIINSGASLNLIYMGPKMLRNAIADNTQAKYYTKSFSMSALVDDGNKNFVTNLGTSGSNIDSSLKDKTYTYDYFAVCSDNVSVAESNTTTAVANGKLDVLYIFVYNSADVVAASDDASIASIKVKGVEAALKAEKTNYDLYEITLTPAQAANSEKRIDVTITNGGATVATIDKNYNSEANAAAKTSGGDFTNNTSAFNAVGSDVYYNIEVTAEDGTTTKTYILHVVVPTYFTVSVDNDCGKAVRASLDGGDAVTIANSAADTQIGYVTAAGGTATIQISGGAAATIALTTGTADKANIWDNGDGTYTISDVTGNVVIDVDAVAP